MKLLLRLTVLTTVTLGAMGIRHRRKDAEVIIPADDEMLVGGDRNESYVTKNGGPVQKGEVTEMTGPECANCKTLRLLFLNKDFTDLQGDGGFVEWISGPFYDADTFSSKKKGKPLGYYSELVNLFGNAPDDTECIVQQVYSFGELPEFSSTINAHAACSSQTHAITGGTGDYACAKGELEFGLETAEFKDATIDVLSICGDLCPNC